MKRSEMIKKIVKRLEIMRGTDDASGYLYYVYPEDDIIAEDILETIEEYGMRPPYDPSQDDGEDTMEWEQE